MKRTKKRLGAAAIALMLFMSGGSAWAEESGSVVRGDITGDGYVGVEDVFYILHVITKYAPSWDDPNAVYPERVTIRKDAFDLDGNGFADLKDFVSLSEGLAGVSDWAAGSHKITSSDKSETAFRDNGEYVSAYVKIKKWMDTAVIYDNTKVEYMGMESSLAKGVTSGKVVAQSFDNKDSGYVDVVSVCPFSTWDPADTLYGTVELKFKKLDNCEDVSFASCTGAGYIQDNKQDGESFAQTAKKYEDALYTEGYIIPDTVSLADAQRALKMSLKIVQIQSADGWNADVNGDGSVTLEDAQKFLRLALKLDNF